MPNDPYPGATFMPPSHSATLFVFLPLCLNLTYSSNGVQSSPSFSRYSSPHLIPLLCVHPLPSLIPPFICSVHHASISTFNLPLQSFHLSCSSLVPLHIPSSLLPSCVASDYMQTFGFHQLTWLHLISSFSCLCSFKLDTRPRACLFSVCSSFRI